MKSMPIRALAVTGAAAVATMTLFGATAGAQTGPGNIDPTASGSLTINKYLHQSGAGGVEADITSGTVPAGFSDPVAGVTFTVHQLMEDGVPVDMTDSGAWAGLDGALPGDGSCAAPAGYTLGASQVMAPTNAAGQSTLPLDLSAYLVCETDAPANIVDRAAPFVVTIPTPNEGEWVYNVNAFPKNGEGSIEKDISPQEALGLGVGSEIEWPVTAPVPTMQGEAWTGFALSDEFDSRLTPVGADSVTLGGTTLTEGTDYEILIDGQTATMNMLPGGLAQLAGAAGADVVVDFRTTINSIGDGTVYNTANLWVNNPTRDSSVRPPMPSNEVHTNWGALQLVKEDAESGNALAGAVFEVYDAVDPYAADCSLAVADEGQGPLTIDGMTEFMSDNTGLVSVPGLFVSDSENAPVDDADRCYVVREAVAPNGYVLPEGADADTPVAVATGSIANVASVTITNSQQTVPQLPLTGGAGTGAMLGLGGALVLGAGAAALIKKRRDEDSVTASA